MIARSRLALLSLLLALIPAASGAQTRLYFGGGPTGTSDFGFRGGWGATLGLEHRFAIAASFLVRGEGGAVPSTGGPFFYGSADILALGETGPGSRDATLLSLMAGLRLGGSGRVRPYLDALVGIGYLKNPSKVVYEVGPMNYPGTNRYFESHTNVALSFGPGIAVRAPHLPAMFADVHYDFYFAEGASTPVIPVRLGLMVP